jgi:hypothetical protein
VAPYNMPVNVLEVIEEEVTEADSEAKKSPKQVRLDAGMANGLSPVIVSRSMRLARQILPRKTSKWRSLRLQESVLLMPGQM